MKTAFFPPLSNPYYPFLYWFPAKKKKRLILICTPGVNSQKVSQVEHDNTSCIFSPHWQEVDARKGNEIIELSVM